MVKTWPKIVAYCYLTIFGAIALVPILWDVAMSLKTPLESFALPPQLIFKPIIDNYRTILLDPQNMLSIDIPLYARNSLIVAIVSTVVSVVIGLLSGFSLARFEVTGQGAIAGFIIATRMLPPIATVIPLFLLSLQFGLLDTLLILVLAYTALNIPLATWLLRSFFRQIPRELEEAAMIDGCSRLQALFQVILPLMGPGVAAAAIFSFLLAWNDLAIALVLTSTDARTLPLAVLAFRGEVGTSWGPMSATAVVLMVPAVAFILFAQRYMMRGLTAGSVKG